MNGATDPAAAIVEAGRILYARSLVASTEGNLSIRLGADRFLMTPSGRCKGRLRARDLITVDGSGRVVAGRLDPSTETALHLAIYRKRPDAGAIIHAHPPTATGFAVAGVPLADCVLPEILLTVGSVPLAPYATPGGAELAARVASVAARHDAFLLRNHGAVSLGDEIEGALHRMEMIESFATILLTARTLGAVEPLDPAEVARLLGRRPGAIGTGERGCGSCRTCRCGSPSSPPEPGGAGGGDRPPDRDPLVEEVLRRVEERLRGGEE